MKQIRMQTTALTGRVMAGPPNAKGNYLTEGSRQDVTSDFMKCLIEKAEFHGGQFDIVSGEDRWVVTVAKQ